ncbi:MAG: adenosine monophosphate-protein transferase, partial [Candidatus Micrarchaeota archaeon]|nr:adenosine monophosphate-protein transferase [Candidatus Micrarchaeota archaeon]
MTDAQLKVVDVEVPKEANVIIGQSHFIKTVEDLYETLMESGMGIKFGLAFC